MADFDPPFAQNGERRLPNANEQSLGWPCGPIDQSLLNGLFHLHNGNIADVINEAGVTGPDGDLTKLRRAIEAIAQAVTGGGTVSDFVLMAQARNRLPIYPDVQNVDGRISVTAPSTGTVRLAGGVEFLHRGIFRITTTQTDFSTDPSKTYHLRWHRTDGFVLRDLASGAYNPGTLSEANVVFDSDFDDMLIARVVTNSSNVASITMLTNRNRILASDEILISGMNPDGPYEDDTSPSAIQNAQTISLNLARRPQVAISAINDMSLVSEGTSVGNNEVNYGIRADSRYRLRAWWQRAIPRTDGIYIAYEVWA